MSLEVARGDTGLQGDNEFHKALSEAANNRVLQQFVRMCGDLLEVEREAHLRAKKSARTVALKQHEALYDAIERGDAEEAQGIMRNHLVNISDVIKGNRKKSSKYSKMSRM